MRKNGQTAGMRVTLRSGLRLIGWWVAGVGGVSPVFAADPAAEAWSEGSRLFYNRAARLLEPGSATGAIDTREARLGRAVMLLGVQPKTAANLAEAEQALGGLVAEREDDDAGLSARYHLARLEQLHRERPDLDRARGHYQRLIEVEPDGYFAHLARLKLAMLALYDTDRPGRFAERLAAAEAWGRAIDDPVLKCDFHYMMSRALALEPGREAERLEHLLAMEATGQVIRGPMRSVMWIELGEMGRAVGRDDVAVRAYREFVREFPMDMRVSTIRARLAALEERR